MFDYLYNPYKSKRMTVFSKNGMVATSQPLAAQAGLDMIKRGGNAIDAAIAAAACLTVVEPTSNGIGGDAFALVWTKNRLHGLNASGPAPRGITREEVLKLGYSEMPKYGWIPVTVPGIPSAWAELSKRFGKLSLLECLKPAVEYAENGYPVSPVVSKYWGIAFDNYSKNLKGEEYKEWFRVFAPDGRAPKTGEVWRSPDHAKTLVSIGESCSDSFYRGELCCKIDTFSKKYGGYIRGEDLENFKPQWVEPIGVNYRGYNVWEIPPNGHGLVALMALNILKDLEITSRDSADTFHKQIEAIKLAFYDGSRYITDPDKMRIKVEDLLSIEHAKKRRALIGSRAINPGDIEVPKGGTVYLAAADGEGNMVSYIQSNYMGFGSGLVVPGTGIGLHNRGNNFSLDPNHDNCLEPWKRPYHTIIPGFLTKDNEAVGPFGVMGAFMQPQGHVQVIMNTIDFNLNPQAALDAPRWQWIKGTQVDVETDFPHYEAETLERMGHNIRLSMNTGSFGRGQIIFKDKNGVLSGGTESRADGAIAAW